MFQAMFLIPSSQKNFFHIYTKLRKTCNQIAKWQGLHYISIIINIIYRRKKF